MDVHESALKSDPTLFVHCQADGYQSVFLPWYKFVELQNRAGAEKRVSHQPVAATAHNPAHRVQLSHLSFLPVIIFPPR